MRFINTLATLGLASKALATYVGSSYWTTLTPSATLEGALTTYSGTFGIAIESIGSSAALRKRADVVTQIGDGQIQAASSTSSEEATSTSSKKTTSTDDSVVTQIGDGQIQGADSSSSTAKSTSIDNSVVTQIGDGQIQGADSSSSTSTKDAVVTQISDGQIQASTSTSSTSSTSTTGAVSQISDGQIQASTTTSSSATSSATSDADQDDYVTTVSCLKSGVLAMTLNDTILYDSKGRIGSIVANHQFQFDGPPPQAGAIYAAGWGISEEGYLAIGNNTVFYECLSGDFYNLYDESIGGQCSPVHLLTVELVSC